MNELTPLNGKKKGAPSNPLDVYVSPGMKRCSACRDIKSYDDFTRDKRGRVGLSAHCKSCRVTESREYAKMIPLFYRKR